MGLVLVESEVGELKQEMLIPDLLISVVCRGLGCLFNVRQVRPVPEVGHLFIRVRRSPLMLSSLAS